MNVIFDFDGTIADSKDYILEVYNSVAKKSNRPHLSQDMFSKLSGMSIFERFKAFNTTLLEATKIYGDVEEKYYEGMDKLISFDGMEETIRELSSSHSLYILSSNSKRIIKKFLEAKGLFEHFTAYYTNRNLLGKARSLKRFISSKKLDPAKVVYIGDEERDIVASKKAKIKSVAVSWGFDAIELIQNTSPDFIAYTPADVLTIIGRLNKDEKNS